MGFDRSLSYYLFARPSFLEGASRVFDIGGVFDSYNESTTPAEADAKSTLHDWMMVGKDMEFACDEYADEGAIRK